jgi:hypothetical protein
MTINDNARTNRFITELQKTVPNFNIKFKNQSTLIKIISYILFFNKQFMTVYITTIGSTVYFPSEQFLESDVPNNQTAIAHEFVHAVDNKNNIIFKLLYLFPQILTPLFIILFFLLPHVFNFISLGVALICLLPIIPAFWRSKDELRGYQMSLFAGSELMKEYNAPTDQYNKYLNDNIDFINAEFTGSGYYWMGRSGVISQLNDTITKIKTDDIIKDDPIYNVVRIALKNSK